MEIVNAPQDDNREIIKNELRQRLYKLDAKIGRGNFADVWKAHHVLSPADNKITVAIKVIDKRERTESDLTKIYREIEILKKLRHPNIIRLYQVFETDIFIFLVTELCGKGELFDMIVDQKRIPEDKARFIYSEILSAVEHAHSQNIVHRDLKTENVLIDENGNIKLADFGFGQYFSSDKLLNTWCGSPPYAAPEVFEGREYEGPELDCWSLGCILYVLVCGHLPFDAPNMEQMKDLVTNGRYQVPWFISNECFDLIRKCLTPNSKRRIKLHDIRNHIWLQGFQSIVEPQEPTVNQSVLKVMVGVGIDEQKILDAVQSSAFNELFGLYHLLLDKQKLQARFNQPRQIQFQNTQYYPTIDQHGFPAMHGSQSQAAFVQQHQELLDPHRQTARRHTFNNVLSTISPMQHQNLQHLYQTEHPASPRHSPQSPSQHPSFSVEQPHCSTNGLPQWQQPILPNNIHPQIQQQRPRVLQPQPPVTQPQSPAPIEQRPWRQGRRASDGLLNGINQDQNRLIEQINPIQMIQEAGDDYDHTWSSIRHPATQMPRNNRGRANREVTLPVVPEEINQISNLSLNNEHIGNNDYSLYSNQYNSPMADMLRRNRNES